MKGDTNSEPVFQDPNSNDGGYSINDVLQFYKKGEYFLTGAPIQDASDNYYLQYLEGEREKSSKYLQGTIMGAFVPVLNNIFGVIIFIRQPQLTAEAGLGYMLLIILICCLCTFITSVSLSALCSNGKMKTGGTYFLFSRALGAPLGTAIGFCFWFATIIAAGQYIIGCVETYILVGWPVFFDNEGDGFYNNIRVIGILFWIVLLAINLFGIKYVSRAGLTLLVIIVIGIIMLFIGFGVAKYDPKFQTETEYGLNGLSAQTCRDNWGPSWRENGFFKAMGIFFPAVTGVLAGSNRSGDLKNPSESIPRGTLAAQVISTFVYLGLSVLFACGGDRDTILRSDLMIATEVAWPNRELMAVAMIISSAAAAIESMAGAPRLLFAMATDGNLKFLNRFQKSFNTVVFINGVLVLGITMIASINFINPLNSMFFLLPYGMLCFVTLFADALNFPNWRPTYNYYTKTLCFIGFVLCIVMMVLISEWYIFLALGLEVIVYYYVKKNVEESRESLQRNAFGDYIDAFFMKIGNYSLRKLVQSKSHVKNWIPSILILGDVTPQGKIDSPGALQFVDNIKSDTCSNIYGYLHRGKFETEDLAAISQKEDAVKQYFDEKKYIFLTKCVQIEHSISRSGIQYLIQSAGMGGLEPNTLITGFPENYRDDPTKSQKFYDIIQQGVLLQKAILVTKPDDLFVNQETEHEGCIDIFSFSYEKGLMLIMPYFLKRSKQYRKCTLRLFILSLKLADEDTEEKEKKTCSEIREFLERYRLYPKIQIKTIFLTPTDFENFILQEYQLFMIQKKRMELINQSKLALAKQAKKQEQEKEKIQEKDENKKDSPRSEKSQGASHQLEMIAISLKKSSEEITVHNIAENQSIQQSDFLSKTSSEANSVMANFKSPEKFLSTIYSKGNNLNKLLLLHSKESDMVILNLPVPVNQDPTQYLDYLRVLTSGLKKVLFIKNESQEVITEIN